MDDQQTDLNRRRGALDTDVQTPSSFPERQRSLETRARSRSLYGGGGASIRQAFAPVQWVRQVSHRGYVYVPVKGGTWKNSVGTQREQAEINLENSLKFVNNVVDIGDRMDALRKEIVEFLERDGNQCNKEFEETLEWIAGEQTKISPSGEMVELLAMDIQMKNMMVEVESELREEVVQNLQSITSQYDNYDKIKEKSKELRRLLKEKSRREKEAAAPGKTAVLVDGRKRESMSLEFREMDEIVADYERNAEQDIERNSDTVSTPDEDDEWTVAPGIQRMSTSLEEVNVQEADDDVDANSTIKGVTEVEFEGVESDEDEEIAVEEYDTSDIDKISKSVGEQMIRALQIGSEFKRFGKLGNGKNHIVLAKLTPDLTSIAAARVRSEGDSMDIKPMIALSDVVGVDASEDFWPHSSDGYKGDVYYHLKDGTVIRATALSRDTIVTWSDGIRFARGTAMQNQETLNEIKMFALLRREDDLALDESDSRERNLSTPSPVDLDVELQSSAKRKNQLSRSDTQAAILIEKGVSDEPLPTLPPVPPPLDVEFLEDDWDEDL